MRKGKYPPKQNEILRLMREYICINKCEFLNEIDDFLVICKIVLI